MMNSFRTPSAFQLRRRRGRQRAAIMVEAVIVISLLSLGLMGLVFFKELYIHQLQAQRLARASIIAHGMGGCEANYPEDWLGPDLGAQDSGIPSRSSSVADGSTDDGRPSAATPDTGSESRAGGFMDGLGQTTSDGKGFLNEMVATELSGQVTVGTSDPESRPFTAAIRARAHTSCGDPVIRDTSVWDAFGRVKDIMGDLFKLDNIF